MKIVNANRVTKKNFVVGKSYGFTYNGKRRLINVNYVNDNVVNGECLNEPNTHKSFSLDKIQGEIAEVA